ncbi:response regulator transcription factor [Bradyrhizobium jicamae]|uniref:LuxR C-terminal-related transcriptional regulator n=1 Tax=Bradyrhizobium jicamae TaxID=280332 RepID=UPI001BA48728|nr:response regulator transcription factor [Bradyrhizobium jicamae]MBR0753314.1 response regulator transcription factor [Bradyrhizobium jicamae]
MHFIRVVSADRHPVVLQGLTKMLSPNFDFEVVAACSDGPSFIEAVRTLAPDIAILDSTMPGVTGPAMLSLISAENLSTRLVLFVGSDEDQEVVMPAAADGYSIISKDATQEVLVRSLREVAAGRRLSPLPSSEQVVAREPGTITENALAVLTDRERQIMRLVSEGLSNKEIGRRLNITDGTIKVHLHHIFQKLEISNRTVLAAIAIAQDDGTHGPSENDPSRIRRS